MVNLSILKNYKYIIVDLDNTLYKYDVCHRFAIKSVFLKYRRTIGCATFVQFKKEYAEAQKNVKKMTVNQAASHSRLLYFQDLVESKFGRTDISLIIGMEKYYWQKFFLKIKKNRKIINILCQCRKSGAVICILTNLTASVQFKKIIHLGLKNIIDFVVTSEEAGKEKPHPAIFRLALDKMGADKARTIFLGDDIKQDATGAARAGIKYININS